jgi:hypothetical protein
MLTELAIDKFYVAYISALTTSPNAIIALAKGFGWVPYDLFGVIPVEPSLAATQLFVTEGLISR